ncbi:MAG: hypothetical protein JO100_17435 [Pseudonocardia sp.]|nr:hypothetical protein [Pseudonocardia sp.]
MNTTVLAFGSAAVIFATSAVLVAYLYIIGTRVIHIAETLQDKIAAGAGEMTGHASGIAPAATALRRHLAALATAPRR